MLFFGLLATKSDQARLIRISVVIAVVYYTLLAFVRVPWQVYPLQVLSAAITAVVGGIAITFFQNFLPEQPGTATNLYSTAGRIGSTVGYLAFGTLASAFGNRAVFWACTALAVLALLVLVRRQGNASATLHRLQYRPELRSARRGGNPSLI